MKTVTALLEQHGSLVFPGIYDALSAKVAAQCGFELAFLSGYATSASHLGLPDMGYLDQSGMLDVARRCVAAVSTPIIADADTGYGNNLNVRQTIRLLKQAGIKGCFLEDQQWPKRCGHMDGKSIISRDEYIAKLTAAVDEIGDDDFFLVARTDALATDGIDEALARMEVAHKAGVDGFFIEAPQNLEQMRLVCEKAPKPLVANMIEGGKTPVLPQEELSQLGYALILYPLTATYATAHALVAALGKLRQLRTSGEQPLLLFAEFNQLIGSGGGAVVQHDDWGAEPPAGLDE